MSSITLLHVLAATKIAKVIIRLDGKRSGEVGMTYERWSLEPKR
jgi:hypothetical protein